MRNIRVHEKSVVLVLSQKDAKTLLWSLIHRYMQENKTKARIVDRLRDAMIEAGMTEDVLSSVEGNSAITQQPDPTTT